PDSAVGAAWGLSDAATSTEEAGLVLGLDSPDRVRLTADGRAVLAFPGGSGGADERSHVRGVGAGLYALLTGKWPLELPEGSGSHDPVDGRPGPAPRDDDDKVLDATEVGSGVAPDSAVLAMRSLDGSTVSSAATVRAMVTDRTGGPVRPASPTARFAAPAAGSAASSSSGASSRPGSSPQSAASSGAPSASGTPSSPADPGDSAASVTGPGGSASGAGTGVGAADDQQWGESSRPDPEVQKRRWQIMAGAGAAAAVAIVLLSMWMLGALSHGQSNTPLSQQL